MSKPKKTKLAQYLKEEGIMQKAFAEKIGTSEPSLLTYLRGERMPPLDIAYRIEKATRGFVTLYDWLKDPEE